MKKTTTWDRSTSLPRAKRPRLAMRQQRNPSNFGGRFGRIAVNQRQFGRRNRRVGLRSTIERYPEQQGRQNPSHRFTTNAACQPYFTASQGTISGVRMAAMLQPALTNPNAKCALMSWKPLGTGFWPRRDRRVIRKIPASRERCRSSAAPRASAVSIAAMLHAASAIA